MRDEGPREVLAQGREPRDGGPPGRRRVLVASTVALALAAAGWLAATSGERKATPPRTAPTAPTAPARVFEPEPPAVFAHPAERMAGPTLTTPTGLRLLVPDDQGGMIQVSADTGGRRPVAGLPRRGTAGGYAVLRLPHGDVLLGSGGCGSCPVYFLPDEAPHGPEVRAVRIGAARAVAAGRGDTVLLVRGGPPGGLAQSVDRAGRPVGAPVRLPAGTTLLREVDGGLLLQSTFDATAEAAPATAEVWDPAAPDAGYDVYRTATGHLVAAGTAAMAWANPGCTAAACSLYITQTALRRGFDTILLPVGALPDTGSFSPDGRLLALRLTLPAAPGRPAATSVAVVDRARGALAVLPGTTVAGAPTSPEPRWIDAHRLALVGGSQLGVWTPTGWDRPDANPGPVAVRPLKRP